MKAEHLEKVGSTMIGEVVMCLLYTAGAHRATKYIDEKTVIRATRPMYTPQKKEGKRTLNGGKGYDTRVNVVVTIGAQNYREREFAKLCRRTGEPFPVKKIQIGMVPERRTG